MNGSHMYKNISLGSVKENFPVDFLYYHFLRFAYIYKVCWGVGLFVFMVLSHF